MDEHTPSFIPKKINMVCVPDILDLSVSLRIVPGPRSRNHTEMFLGRMVCFGCPSAEQQEPDTGTVKRCRLLVHQLQNTLEHIRAY